MPLLRYKKAHFLIVLEVLAVLIIWCFGYTYCRVQSIFGANGTYAEVHALIVSHPCISFSEPLITTWTWDYEIAVHTQESVVIDVARIIFMGPSSSGKSSFKHLLAYTSQEGATLALP